LNWKTFFALLSRDAHVARRNLFPLLLQNLLQPLLLTFVFGRVLTTSGMMHAEYKNVMLPGVMAICMSLSGVQAVAMPVIAEFEFTREIEDRLLAPIATAWLGVAKIVTGMVQALVAGLVVIPAAWLTMGSGVSINLRHPLEFAVICLLVALCSAAGGLALGCSVGQTQVGLMFTLIIAPLMTFGCAYYPWAFLGAFPVLKYAVLINPLVYVSEGLRGMLAPQLPHINTFIALAALLAIDVGFVAIGLSKFVKKAVN
jgi:ABC-2 type transport system permease protein